MKRLAVVLGIVGGLALEVCGVLDDWQQHHSPLGVVAAAAVFIFSNGVALAIWSIE